MVEHQARLTVSFDAPEILLWPSESQSDTVEHGVQGLCFSVRPGVKVPPSLRNIYKEIKEEFPSFAVPTHGYALLTSINTHVVRHAKEPLARTAH